MGKFRIIPSIYLYNGNVVDKETKEIVGDGDAVELATFYNNRGADELLVFDLSSSDSEHDANIGTMIKIQDAVDIQMIVGGNVKRLEDVKKYIYTGVSYEKTFPWTMALLAAVTLVACGSKKDAYESIKENKKLVVAVSPDYAPFEFKTLVDGKDQVVGSDIKLAQAIADELGVKLEVTTMSFDNVLSSLQAGKADIAISGISVNRRT